MRDEAEKRISHLNPKVRITPEMVNDPVNPSPDLKPYEGQELTVIAWLWARTVKSPNPAFSKIKVALASTFILSSKSGNEAYVQPVIEGENFRFVVNVGMPEDAKAAKEGTRIGRGNFRCLMSGNPIAPEHIKSEAMAGRMKARLMAIVVEGSSGRVYLTPTAVQEAIALKAQPQWKPDVEFFQQALGFRIGNYGMTKWSDLFTPRQLVSLTTLSDLAREAIQQVRRDVIQAGLPCALPRPCAVSLRNGARTARTGQKPVQHSEIAVVARGKAEWVA